jgi:hydrogenase expression/formation protein HypC
MRVVACEGLTAMAEPISAAPGADAVPLERIDLALLGPLEPGVCVLTHLGVGVQRLEADEARAIADALMAVRMAERGLPFEHLIADLIEREPQLPPHLQAQANRGGEIA